MNVEKRRKCNEINFDKGFIIKLKELNLAERSWILKRMWCDPRAAGRQDLYYRVGANSPAIRY